MSTGLTGYVHPSGFSMPVPPGWDTAEDPAPGVALVAAEPDNGGFRANLVVTVDELPADLDLTSWQATVEPMLGTALHDYILIDAEETQVRGRPTFRRLAHHLVEKSGAVTMEQWAHTEGATGYTVTASVATLAYASLADLFAEVVDGWEPAPGSGHPAPDPGGRA